MEYDSKFCDKSYILDEIPSNSYEYNIDKKIAIHIHVFYIDMLDIVIGYLKNSPYKFDLLISVNSEENKNICIKKINNNSLKKLNKLLIKVVPNIGRDIAPLLIDFKEEQKDYDLFCHLHTKKSLQTIRDTEWLDYLLRNLISKKAIKNIVHNFNSDNNIGIIFPPVYMGVLHWVLKLADIDRINMEQLLKRMSVNFTLQNNNFLYSPGTMFWYRPNSLKKLFDLNLSYNDFPKEPIPTTGTIAHALERLVGIVAQNNGYNIRLYICREDLISSLIYAYELKKDIINKDLEINSFKINIVEEYKLKIPWFSIFNIYNNSNTLRIVIFGIKITIKMTPEKINRIAWWIPIRKLRDNFRNKFK